MNKQNHQEENSNTRPLNNAELIESLNDNISVSTNDTDNSEDISNLVNTIFLSNDNSSELNRYQDHRGSIFNTKNSVLNKEVTIKDSENVKVGNITIFQGPVHFHENRKKTERNTKNENELFRGKFMNRITWLAQGPLNQCEIVNEPVPLIIICETGTEAAKTQSENKYIIRHIQCYHIESERWNDIGYNFLIGADGYVYEGRGWGVVGKHSDDFNNKSVGIAFVGTYKEELPPQESLMALKILIEDGIQKKFISQKYSLECQNNLMPWKYNKNQLIDIIKTWKY